jgi:hypothetical protein
MILFKLGIALPVRGRPTIGVHQMALSLAHLAQQLQLALRQEKSSASRTWVLQKRVPTLSLPSLTCPKFLRTKEHKEKL